MMSELNNLIFNNSVLYLLVIIAAVVWMLVGILMILCILKGKGN